METTTACLNDHHHFSDYDDDDEDDHYNNHRNRRRIFSLLPPPSFAFPESIEEEELEWISNKDAFAMAESFVDILPNHPSISSATTTTTTATTTTTTTTTTSHDNNGSSHLSLSPVSVLENSSTTSCSNNNGSGIGSGSGSGSGSGGYVNINNLRCFFKVPGKARTKRPNRRREMSGERFQCWEKVRVGHGPGPGLGLGLGPRKSGIGRKCLHCGSEKTPQWRAGPNGPKTLCNACGVRYKSGRLVPEYRPASSPTFSSELHSNSHRKIVEMRKQKMGDGEGDGDGHGGVF